MSELLIGEVRISQRRNARLVRAAVDQLVAELAARGGNATGKDERGITEIDERNLTAVFDSPSVAQHRRQTRLASMGHLRGRDLAQHGTHCSKELVTRIPARMTTRECLSVSNGVALTAAE